MSCLRLISLVLAISIAIAIGTSDDSFLRRNKRSNVIPDFSDLITTEVEYVISINFTQSLPFNIFPSRSKNITFRYSLTDSRGNFSDVYTLFFTMTTDLSGYPLIDWMIWNDDAGHWESRYTPNGSILLDISNCVCHVDICLYCEQQINIFDFLSEPFLGDFEDRYVTAHDFDFKLSHPYHFNVLLTPRNMTVHWQRCNISFYPDGLCAEDEPIPITFNLSDNCYSEIGAVHLVYIEIAMESGYLFNEDSKSPRTALVINITSNQSKSCDLCTIPYVNGNASNEDMIAITQNCIHLSHDEFKFEYQPWHVMGYYDALGIHDYNKETDYYVLGFVTHDEDVFIPQDAKSVTTKFISKSVKSLKQKLSTVLWLLLCIIPCICCMCFVFRKYRRYKNVSLIVKKALVLIIGIAQFDKPGYMLDRVGENVRDLIDLWREKYKYEVFVCNEGYLYSTKDDIIEFIDEHKSKLIEKHYDSVILHVISHGSNKGQSFLSSDLQLVQMEFIRHELTESMNEQLIKIIFNHVCRGEETTQTGKTRASAIVHNDGVLQEPCGDSNWAIVYGNIINRAIMDDGCFTKYICEVFGNNLNGLWKKCFTELCTDIAGKVQNETRAADICEANTTLCVDGIRFEANGKVMAKSKRIQNGPLLSSNVEM
eukprot:658650_1